MSHTFITRLGRAIWPHLKSGKQPRHVPTVFDASWIGSLPLPLKAGAQPVALIDGLDFHREQDEKVVTAAYQARPRTRAYESVNVHSDGWVSAASLHLAGLLRRHVVCTLYESRAGDRTLGAHDDEWLGVIVQMHGAKRWELWPERTGAGHEVLTRAGDVLVLPQGVTHAVSTPEYSVHLVFAVTDERIGLQRPAC
ncbi:cupin domain-containing protein [Streptomyces kanamyceticus]|nr:cupin domain-containing protein [Streptomyces kanamyceticus]